MGSSSIRVQTAQQYIDAFADLATDKFMAVRTDDCEQIFAPASLGMPNLDNAGYATHLANLRTLVARFPITAKEMVDSDGDNAVTVWATSEAHIHPEYQDDSLTPEEWIYRSEYIFVLYMDPSGRRIKRIVEFVDSKQTQQAFTLMGKAGANMQKKQQAGS